MVSTLFWVRKQGPCCIAKEKNGRDKRLAHLEHDCELMVLLRQILFNLAIAETILMRIFAKQVSSSHRVPSRYLKLVTSPNFWPFMLIPAVPVGSLSSGGDVADYAF